MKKSLENPIVKPAIKKKKVVRKKKKIIPIDTTVPAVKRPAHRPSVYSYKYIELAEKYLASCVDTERKRIKTEGETSTSWEYGVNVNLPTIEGLVVFYYNHGIGVSRDTIYQWKSEKDKIEFSYILEKIMSEQANRLLKNGLNGDYNSTIAKMMLTKHGYVEKTENDTTFKGNVTLVDGLLNLSKVKQKEEN